MLSEFNRIRETLLSGDIEKTLQQLSEQSVIASNPKLRNELLLHLAKCRSLAEQRRSGTIDEAMLAREENRIRAAILELVDLVESKSVPQFASSSYDVFISYRREDGSQLARLICAELLRRNKKAFLDVENLGSGSWDVSLLDSIANSRCLVIVLTPGVLSRIHEADDVLHRELSHALSLDKKIIPVVSPEFKMPNPDQLPIALSSLPMQNGITYSHEFFPAMIDKLVHYLA